MKNNYQKIKKENPFPQKKDVISNNPKGSTIQLISNCFDLQVNKFQKFQQFDFQIYYSEDQDKIQEDNHKIPEAVAKDSRQKRELILSQYSQVLTDKLGFYVLTGSQIFSVFQSKIDTKFVLSLQNNEYCIKVKMTNSCLKFKDLNNDPKCKGPLMQLINTFIKDILRKKNFEEWGNNKKFYDPKLAKFLPHYSLKIFKGCTYKADLYEEGIKLLVSPCYKFIRMKNLYEELLERDIDNEEINDYFKERSVYATYNQKMFILAGADITMNLKSVFPNQNYKNYKDYFEKQYNIQFKYPEQFLVYTIQENSNERQYYPPEILMPTGLTQRMLNDTTFMKQLAKYTINDPKQNLDYIENSISNLDLQQNRTLKLKVDLSKNQVQATLMETPKFLKKGNKTFQNKQFQIKEFYNSKDLNDWLFFYDYKNKVNQNTVISNLIKTAKNLHYQVSEPKKFLMERNFDIHSIKKVFKGLQKRPQMVVFFMDRIKCNRIYKKLKIFLMKKGVQSQCFVDFNKYKDQNCNKKYYNLLTQISVKSGSTPWALELNVKDAILMGFDVFHQRKQKSVASLVTFYGKNYTKQHCSTQMQKGGLEITKNILQLFIEHMKVVEEKTKKIPEKIIFYRDGVGEGQIEIVKQEELQRIMTYLKNKYGDDAPKLTFILITKRLDQRFLLKDKKNIQNPNEGVVITENVVKSDRPNFYLIANKVTQGTAVPTHYDVILNENNYELKELTQLTYSLTHMYFNWTGTVKVPAMAQYAHKQAYQVGLYQDDQVHKKMKDSLFFL